MNEPLMQRHRIHRIYNYNYFIIAVHTFQRYQVGAELSTGRMDPRVGSGRVKVSPGRVGSKKSDPWTTLS